MEETEVLNLERWPPFSLFAGNCENLCRFPAVLGTAIRVQGPPTREVTR